MNRVRSRQQSGFTLMEIMVAMALLTLLMAVILTPMLGLFGFSRTSENILDANSVAQQRLEEARAAVAASYNSPTGFSSQLTALGVTCKNIGLYGAELAPNCSGTTTPPLRRLSVTVSENNQTVTASVDVVGR